MICHWKAIPISEWTLLSSEIWIILLDCDDDFHGSKVRMDVFCNQCDIRVHHSVINFAFKCQTSHLCTPLWNHTLWEWHHISWLWSQIWYYSVHHSDCIICDCDLMFFWSEVRMEIALHSTVTALFPIVPSFLMGLKSEWTFLVHLCDNKFPCFELNLCGSELKINDILHPNMISYSVYGMSCVMFPR